MSQLPSKAVEALGAATIGAVGPGALVTQVPRGPGATQTINDGTGGSGAFVSYNQTTSELWITLNRTLNAATTISVSP